MTHSSYVIIHEVLGPGETDTTWSGARLNSKWGWVSVETRTSCGVGQCCFASKQEKDNKTSSSLKKKIVESWPDVDRAGCKNKEKQNKKNSEYSWTKSSYLTLVTDFPNPVSMVTAVAPILSPFHTQWRVSGTPRHHSSSVSMDVEFRKIWMIFRVTRLP